MVRIYLGLVALMMISSVAYVLNPDAFALNGQALGVLGAKSDVRAIYGAFPMAVGLFLVPAALRPGSHLAELRLCVLIFVLVPLGRLVGLAIDGGDQHFNLACLAVEAAFGLAGLALWLRERRAA